MSTETNPSPVIGVLGVGAMGRPMVERLVSAGHEVRFFARRPEVVADVASLGAEPAESIVALAQASDVVVVCVFSDDQVLELALGDGGLLSAMAPGSTLVNHTTGSPTTAARLAERAASRGVHFLDAALSGGPNAVASGTLTLLVGGDADVLANVAGFLSAYSEPIQHVGGVGDGQKVKLVNNALFTAGIALVSDAERLASELGLVASDALGAVTQCSGTSFALEMVHGLGSAASAWELAGPFMGKDIDMVRQVAAELGADIGLLGDVVASLPAAPGRSV